MNLVRAIVPLVSHVTIDDMRQGEVYQRVGAAPNAREFVMKTDENEFPLIDLISGVLIGGNRSNKYIHVPTAALTY